MAQLKSIKDSQGNNVFVDDKGFVYKGTPDYGAHGDQALSSHLFKKTGQTLDNFNSELSKKSQNSFFATQKAQEDSLMGRFRDTIQNQESLGSMSDRISGELGIPEAQNTFLGLNQSVNNLASTLNNLPNQIENETRGFDVNQAQLGRITESRGVPLRQNLGEMSRNLGVAGTNLNALNETLAKRLGFAAADQEKALKPFELEASMLSDRLAREATGFSQDNQREFELLLNKIQNDQQMTMTEMLRANELADAETAFNREKDLIAYRNSYDVNPESYLEPFLEDLRGVLANNQQYNIQGSNSLNLSNLESLADNIFSFENY